MSPVLLVKTDILRGLYKIDAMAKSVGMLIDLSIYGGAALAMVFDLRDATRDVDAVVNGSPAFLREAAKAIAEDEGWPEDWLNDGVKGFVSSNEQMELMASFNPTSVGGLRVQTPTLEYMFAMKCMAMRPDGIDGSHDISDIRALASKLELRTADDALKIVESFYPSNRIPPKVIFGIEEIVEGFDGNSPIEAHTTPTPKPE